MLETKIAELTAQIAVLIEVLQANVKTAQPQQAVRQLRQPEQPTAAPAAPAAPKKVDAPTPTKAEPDADADSEVTIDMLRDICMTITRPDAKRKPEVVAVISSFGGALKVQDVAVADRKALLERLKLL